jgi:hypothetical protein
MPQLAQRLGLDLPDPLAGDLEILADPSALRKVSLAFATVYFLGNLTIPGAVLLGKLKPQSEAPVAAAAAAHR